MVHYSCFFTFIIVLIGSHFGKCAEFVPVYMWGTAKMSEHVPALHKISEDSFKDTLLEYLKNDPYIIVFAEHTLSPEDFAQRDQNGDIAFPNIFNLKKSQTYVTYKPYVQNPIGAIKQLDKQVTELSIGSLLNSPNVPKNNILVIDLNDAREDEQRYHMLKRHDSDVVSIYKDILEQHDNVLALYTAHHTSWVAPEDVTHKKSRHLLAEEAASEPTPDPSVFTTDDVLMYLSDEGGFYINHEKKLPINNVNIIVSSNQNQENTTVNLKPKSPVDFLETIQFEITSYTGYWTIQNVTVQKKDGTKIPLKLKDIYAPFRFSYHCGDLMLNDSVTNQSLVLPGFQFQLFDQNSTAKASNLTFGDAYDCVGFTSVPIWSALFVTAILLLIMTFGLTMMMDIKTMDRFDDAKGKTIIINASE